MFKSIKEKTPVVFAFIGYLFVLHHVVEYITYKLFTRYI